MRTIAVRDQLAIGLYLLALGLSSLHLYRKPVYAMDAVQYLGNALLMEDQDIVSVHRRVYAELHRRVPSDALRVLLGDEPGSPTDQNESRRERARNPYRYGEFLPLFAIRPLYNQSIWLLNRLGVGLLPAAIFISVASYFAIGVLLLVWMEKYAGWIWASALAFLLMISPPLTELGREITSDAAATVVAFAGLYLIFETRRLAAGLTLLLASIFFRTDFIVLAGPVLLFCWLNRSLDFWKAAILAVVAVASVFTINHFAGDYGIQMLYYRNFLGVPVAPGEMTPRFTLHDYGIAFRSGVTLAANSFLIPFLLLGVVGLTQRRVRALFAVTLSYVFLHFIALPNWQERWVGIFYLCCGICAGAAVAGRLTDTSAQPAPQGGAH